MKRELYAKIQRIVEGAEQELVILNNWTFAILIKRKDPHQTWYEHFIFLINPPDRFVKMITDNKQYVLFDILLSIRYYMNFVRVIMASLVHLHSCTYLHTAASIKNTCQSICHSSSPSHTCNYMSVYLRLLELNAVSHVGGFIGVFSNPCIAPDALHNLPWTARFLCHPKYSHTVL